MRALVTGGAGNIGGAIARRLAENGYTVAIADLADPGPDLLRVVDTQLRLDVSSEEGAREAVRTAAGSDGLDVLVNSLGISPKKDGRRWSLTEITLEEWRRVVSVNLDSCFLTMREAVGVLKTDVNASIVNVVSSVGKLGSSGPDGTRYGPAHPAAAHYCAAKAGLANLTVSGARELAPRGIRCNGVAPGYIGAGMGGTTDPDVEERLVAQVPLGRPGTAAEVAGVVSFLAGPDASYLTGEIIDIDGGWAPD